jgi:hypothetical protein
MKQTSLLSRFKIGSDYKLLRSKLIKDSLDDNEKMFIATKKKYEKQKKLVAVTCGLIIVFIAYISGVELKTLLLSGFFGASISFILKH